jgi:hypothetical protein
MLQILGYYVGDDLNESLDNLWFTFLFKRPGWYRTVEAGDDEAFADALRVFVGAMHGRRPGFGDTGMIARAFFDQLEPPFGRAAWSAGRAASLIRAGRGMTDPARWGWKEPNAQLFLPRLAAGLGPFRYVHVVRHGLDMAFSSNQNQLYNFGWLFGIDPATSNDPLPRLALEYWAAANTNAVETADRMPDVEVCTLNFDQMCERPGQAIEGFVRFLGLDPTAVPMDRLLHCPVTPKGSGRFREHDLSILRPQDVEAVERFGFSTT